MNTSGSNHGPAASLNGRAGSTSAGRTLPVLTQPSDRHRATVEELLRLVLDGKSPQEARGLVAGVVERLRAGGLDLPDVTSTPYLNTIPPEEQPEYPGDLEMERLIRAHVRWNAMAMVAKANKTTNVGGHIATFASLATLYEVGFNHFFRGGADGKTADMIYFQGHASPGNYARAYLEYRLNDQHLKNFRQELQDHPGLSSYPHPFLMPDFWIFPTVSMGLGPIHSIYQARFSRYLQARKLVPQDHDPMVWAFIGDGESDEPETHGAIGMAGREHLDNLVWVINCNLQRLDGPVRGNGKIIQDLEGQFRGAGWNVIKVVWGSDWDELLARDKTGLLARRMDEVVDGEYQQYVVESGAYIRRQFFGKYPELLDLVSHLTDAQLKKLTRGGHDPRKVYAAYLKATQRNGRPTVILAKTVKGYGMGRAGEAKNPTHQLKKLDAQTIREFRDRFAIPVSDERLEELPFYRPSDDAPEMRYMHERRRALGGYLPQRRRQASEPLIVPELSALQAVLEPTPEGREISTTQAFVRVLTALVRDKSLGPRIVPIVPDEARTFGMEGMFRQLGIYAPEGQKYTPVDKDQVMYYREDKAGQILEEGINEAGAFSSWIAAATSYATNDRQMVPFYIYYSMFGFQRIGDLAWAAGDMQARGFLLGGTAGRTTLNGEGLQHEDGHSHILSSTIPNCVSYDPAFAHELAVIIHDGLERMVTRQENVFYYLTVMNENYPHPGLRPGDEEGIVRGMYLLRPGQPGGARAQLLGSCTILREVMAAAELLERDWQVAADVWSVTSFTELRRDGLDCERWNLLHPTEPQRVPYVARQLAGHAGPVIASTDYMKLFADQIRPFVPRGRDYRVLGTDGFGRSDFRAKLREHFEVNRHFVVVTALRALADEGAVPLKTVADAISRYGIDPDKANPMTA